MSLVARVVAVIQAIGADIKALQASSSGAGTPTGAIAYFPSTTAPTGWLKINGALLNRAAYPELYSYGVASGNMAASDATWQAGQFSPGDGSTTFRIPDARGEWVRGWDDGRGVDASRAIGSWADGQNKSHTHTATATSAGAHTHSILSNASGQSSASYATAAGVASLGVSGSAGAHTHPITVTATGGTEVSVRGVAWLCCIKY